MIQIMFNIAAALALYLAFTGSSRWRKLLVASTVALFFTSFYLNLNAMLIASESIHESLLLIFPVACWYLCEVVLGGVHGWPH